MEPLEEPEDLFDINKLQIDPEISPISSEVDIAISFQVKKPISNIKWKVNYIIDSTGKRMIIELFET